MLTSFTPAQIDQLRRDAQRLRKRESLTHYEALDRIAAKNGYRNWSLLSKHSAAPESSPVPASPPLSMPPSSPPVLSPVEVTDPRRRYYLHGDRDEENSSRYYCAQCDVFLDAAHFASHGPHTGERFLQRLERWNKRDAHSLVTWRRPTQAPNLLESEALAARSEYQANRQEFSDWLWTQRDQKNQTGLMARGLMSSRGLPKTPKSLSQLVRHYERNGKQYFSPNSLFEAWSEFKRQVRASQ